MRAGGECHRHVRVALLGCNNLAVDENVRRRLRIIRESLHERAENARGAVDCVFADLRHGGLRFARRMQAFGVENVFVLLYELCIGGAHRAGDGEYR